MNINDMKSGEVKSLEKRLKRTVRLCKTIYAEADQIADIKKAIDSGDLVYASQLFHEWDTDTQRLMMIAPLYGGAFNPQERNILKGLWEISVEDIE